MWPLWGWSGNVCGRHLSSPEVVSVRTQLPWRGSMQAKALLRVGGTVSSGGRLPWASVWGVRVCRIHQQTGAGCWQLGLLPWGDGAGCCLQMLTLQICLVYHKEQRLRRTSRWALEIADRIVCPHSAMPPLSGLSWWQVVLENDCFAPVVLSHSQRTGWPEQEEP